MPQERYAMNKYNFSIFFIFVSTPAFAYIGPGMGSGVLISILGFFTAIFLLLFGILYYPIKRAFKNKKNKSLNSKIKNR